MGNFTIYSIENAPSCDKTVNGREKDGGIII